MSEKREWPREERGSLSVDDAVVFRTRGPIGEVLFISTTDDPEDGGQPKYNLVNAEGHDCGVYYRGELMRVSSPFLQRIKELEAQVARMRASNCPHCGERLGRLEVK